MQRRHVYLLLAAPLLILAVVLLILPAETRSTFFSEFQHRTKLMFGYEPPPFTGEDGKELGLRLESPEEYGPAGDETAGDVAAETEDADDAGQAAGQSIEPAEGDDANTPAASEPGTADP